MVEKGKMNFIKPMMVCVLLVSSNAFATEVFKCVQSDGKNVFSDKPCPKGAEEEKVTYKDLPWDQALIASKPDDVKVIDVKTTDGDTLITYQFFSNADASRFMRLAHDLSKQNINLLKIKAPINGQRGEAVIQVTKKETNVFKEMDKKKSSPTPVASIK
jgi:hypothetical protein